MRVKKEWGRRGKSRPWVILSILTFNNWSGDAIKQQKEISSRWYLLTWDRHRKLGCCGISDNRIGTLRRNTTDEAGSPVRARDMVLKGMTISRSRRTMVGYLTVLRNAMGGQGSMSCGTSKSEAYCQQSESSITQGHKGCFGYMLEEFHRREHRRKACSLSLQNRQPEQ